MNLPGIHRAANKIHSNLQLSNLFSHLVSRYRFCGVSVTVSGTLCIVLAYMHVSAEGSVHGALRLLRVGQDSCLIWPSGVLSDC